MPKAVVTVLAASLALTGCSGSEGSAAQSAGSRGASATNASSNPNAITYPRDLEVPNTEDLKAASREKQVRDAVQGLTDKLPQRLVHFGEKSRADVSVYEGDTDVSPTTAERMVTRAKQKTVLIRSSGPGDPSAPGYSIHEHYGFDKEGGVVPQYVSFLSVDHRGDNRSAGNQRTVLALGIAFAPDGTPTEVTYQRAQGASDQNPQEHELRLGGGVPLPPADVEEAVGVIGFYTGFVG